MLGAEEPFLLPAATNSLLSGFILDLPKLFFLGGMAVLVCEHRGKLDKLYVGCPCQVGVCVVSFQESR